MSAPVGPPLFFVDHVGAPVLSSPDHHHAARVLRVRDGDAITVSDGAGAWRSCRFGPELVVDSDVCSEPAVTQPITVCFALTKSTKPEFVVQKLTEVGVDRIVPFTAERSVVRWDGDKTAARLQRWQVVAREASMQSRRVWLPEVAPVATFSQVAHGSAVLADTGGRAVRAGDRLVLIGPEGGWSDDERASVPDRVCFSPGVLRAETAAVVAGALLTALRGGFIRE